MDFLKLFTHWNIILWLLGLCSLIGVAVFIERVRQLSRAEVDSDRFLLTLRQRVQDGDLIASIELCDESGGTLANIIKAGLLRHHRPQSYIENAMEMAGRLEIANLEKNAQILAIISTLAPLVGLLGTVLGFIQAFGEMRLSGLVDITATGLGSALEYALITTAAGLVVAIPALLAYHYLVSRIEKIVLEIQVVSAEVVEMLLTREG